MAWQDQLAGMRDRIVPMAQDAFGKVVGGEPQTYEEMVRKRALAELMAQRVAMGRPQNVGEGLGSITAAIASRRTGGQADKAATAGRERVSSALSELMGQRMGGGASMGGPQAMPFLSQGGSGMDSLIQNESGGNWGALNDEEGAGGRGHGGRAQFGTARLQDAANAGIIPSLTPQQFAQQPPEVQKRVEDWHFAEIDMQAANRGLTKFVGQNVGGVQVTPEAIRSMAHLGGIGGAEKFLESGGQHNPADSFGTSLRDYGQRHGGAGVGAMSFTGGQPDVSFVSQGGGGGMDPRMAAIMADPYVNELPAAQRGALAAMFEQQMQAQTPMTPYQQAQIGLQRDELAARNRPEQVRGVVVGDNIVNPSTGEVIYQLPAGQSPAELSLNPIYGRDAEGRPVVMQIGKDGTAVQTRLPEGVTPDLAVKSEEAARGTAIGKSTAEAQMDLPSALAKADRAIANLKAVRDDPALPSITGMIQGRLPPMTGAGTDLNVRIQQAQGQAFLEAFESLKGAGQITEPEGVKATQAIARLDRAQSLEAYQTALNDLIDVLESGKARALGKAGASSFPPASDLPAPPGGYSAATPADDDLLRKYGG